MTREEAVKYLTEWKNAIVAIGDTLNSHAVQSLTMAIDSLQSKWIPVKWHEITDEEREREGYPKDWVYHFDCVMPDDEQRILITTKCGLNGFVEFDECYCDGEYALDSGFDWLDDVLAWMPLPDPYKECSENA